MRAGPTLLTLRDEKGRTYIERLDPKSWGRGDPSESDVARFESLPDDALDLALEVPFVYIEDRSGEWTLDLPLAAPANGTLAGNVVRGLGIHADAITAGPLAGPAITLEFDSGGWQGDRRVLAPREPSIDGVGTGTSYPESIRSSDPRPWSSLQFPTPRPLEAKRLSFTGATVQVRGPWKLRFTRT